MTLPRSLGLTLLLCALPPPPAVALDTLEEVACVCADDALNTGDYVSCVAHLSRRLVAKAAITRSERSRAVSAASEVDFGALDLACESAAGGDDEGVQGWGVALETDSPFYRADAVTGQPAVASAVLRQWNLTAHDAFQANQNGSQPECQYEVLIRDRRRNVVRREFPTCGRTFVARDLLAGESESTVFEVPLVALNAETGLMDGEPLPPAVYRIELTWSRQGPQAAPDFVTEGGLPSAGVAVRVLD